MASKRGLTGKDAFARMNYLYQASAMCSSFSSKNSKILSAYYGSLFKNVAKKAVVRAEPEMKRTLCKGCCALLVPGKNVKMSLKKKPAARIIWTCLQCFTIKRFGVRKDYKIWLECDEAVVEKNYYGNSVDKKQDEQEKEIKNKESASRHSVLHGHCVQEMNIVHPDEPVSEKEDK